MIRTMVYHRKKIWMVFLICIMLLLGLVGRLWYLMNVRAEYYSKKAEDLHERERDIKAARGKILDIRGNILADNRTVCTVSVIHSQIKDPEKVIRVLSGALSVKEEEIRKKVEKVSSIERIQTNVEKSIGDKIREYDLEGVKVDEDYRRYYPYGSLASKVLGFTGGDNQGIIGLEVKYDEILKGEPGKILTVTDARGVEIDGTGERRKEPVSGNTLRTSLDVNIQEYVQQAAGKVMEEKQADILWQISDSFAEDKEKNSMEQSEKVDFIMTLDNISLVAAGECSSTNNLHGAVLYGIGHSMEAFYYLDTGEIQCLVVPDEFNRGYQSVAELSDSLRRFMKKPERNTVSYSTVRRETLFSKENQEVLFTMSQ